MDRVRDAGAGERLDFLVVGAHFRAPGQPELVVVVESTRSEDDMRALFHDEVKPRLARRPEVGAYNQEI